MSYPWSSGFPLRLRLVAELTVLVSSKWKEEPAETFQLGPGKHHLVLGQSGCTHSDIVNHRLSVDAANHLLQEVKIQRVRRTGASAADRYDKIIDLTQGKASQ